MAKNSDFGVKKINELSDQGDVLCSLSKTTVLTRKSGDDGGYIYGKLNIVKGSQWTAVNLPTDVMIEKCALIGAEQIVTAMSSNKIGIYSISGHHIRSVGIQKKGRAKTVENITAIAVISDKVLVAESKRYNSPIHVIECHTGENQMTLSIDEKVVGIIPVKPGLIYVRLKEKIQAVDFLSYPRVDVEDVIAYGRTLVNMCVKGANDELYVMYVKGITPKVLEIHVIDDSYEEIYHTKITHTTSILSLRAVFTRPGPGYLVIQMGNAIFTFKCVDANRKSTGKSRRNSGKTRNKFYPERIMPSTPSPIPVQSNPGENDQSNSEYDSGDSTNTTPRKTSEEFGGFNIGPVLLEQSNENPLTGAAALDVLQEKAGEASGEHGEDRLAGKDPRENPDIRRVRSAPPKSPVTTKKDAVKDAVPAENNLNKSSKDEKKSAGKEAKTSVIDKYNVSPCVTPTHSPVTVLQDQGDVATATAFESKFIGEDGGEITSEKYGFSVKIPAGAIPKGQRRQIGVGLLREPSDGSAPHGSCNGIGISPSIFCEPSGLRLDKPARIKVQHCLSSWSNDTHISVHEDVDDGERDEREGDGDARQSNARCSLGKNEIELEVSRLGKYSLKVMGSEIFKKLACRPFIPRKMPSTKKPIINVLIYDHTEGMKKIMMDNMEADSPYPVSPAHIGKNFILKLSADDAREITLGCSTADGRTQEKRLSVTDLLEFQTNSVDFQVDCNDRAPKDVTIELAFGNKKIDMICHVDIPHPDGHAPGETRVDRSSADMTPRKTSTSADIDPPTDVPSHVLHEIAREVPHNYYIPLGLKLGLEKAKLDSFVVSCSNDHGEATYRALEAWKNREGVDNRAKLKELLIESDLRRIAERYLP